MEQTVHETIWKGLKRVYFARKPPLQVSKVAGTTRGTPIVWAHQLVKVQTVWESQTWRQWWLKFQEGGWSQIWMYRLLQIDLYTSIRFEHEALRQTTWNSWFGPFLFRLALYQGMTGMNDEFSRGHLPAGGEWVLCAFPPARRTLISEDFPRFFDSSILVALAVEHHRTQQGMEHLPDKALVAYHL